MTYTFKINQLVKKDDVANLENVIKLVSYTCTATDEIIGKSHNYHHYVKLPSPDSDNFIDFNTLTEDQVITWVQANVDMTHIEEVCTEKLNHPEPETLDKPWGDEDHVEGGMG